jgi:hypothetical protein
MTQLHKATARVHNAAIASRTDPLMPVPNDAGEIPPEFPATVGHLHALGARALDDLVAFYNTNVEQGPGQRQGRRIDAVKWVIGVRY